MKWIVHDCLPFHCVESVNLRHVFEILHPHCPVYAAESIQHRIAWLYVETKQQLQRLLHGKKGLSFTTDHWTSMAGDNYVSLTVHYIKDYERVTHILACTRHEGTTSSEEMYAELIEATLDWGVKIEQMFALVSDTEGKMNRMGIILERERTRHLYCAAHNFQLTAVIAFSASIDGLTALRALVAFIRKSTQASDKLKASQVKLRKKNLRMIQEVKTRWGSTFKMIDRALVNRPLIKDMMENEFVHHKKRDKKTELEKLELSDDHWEDLVILQTLLRPFQAIQQLLEGNKYTTLSLLPYCVHVGRTMLTDMVRNLDTHGTNPKILLLAEKMMDDYEERWGKFEEGMVYEKDRARGFRNRQVGLPYLAIWAALLDPRLKPSIDATIPELDRIQAWIDIK